MQWIVNMAMFLVISGLMLELIADTKYYKFARFVAGIIFLLQFIRPLTEHDDMGNRFAALFRNFDYALGSERVLEEIYQAGGETESRVLEEYKQTILEQIDRILQKNGLYLQQGDISVETDGNIERIVVRAAYEDGSADRGILVPTVVPVRIGEETKTDMVSPLELYIREVLAEFYQLEENKIEVVIQEAN